MELKKRDLEGVLLVTLAFDEKTQAPVAGLLLEEAPLALKRKLQKIRSEALKLYEELKLQEKEVFEKYKSEDQKEQLQLELKILHDETVTLLAEPASLQMVESIRSKYNYDFEIIEKITNSVNPTLPPPPPKNP